MKSEAMSCYDAFLFSFYIFLSFFLSVKKTNRLRSCQSCHQDNSTVFQASAAGYLSGRCGRLLPPRQGVWSPVQPLWFSSRSSRGARVCADWMDGSFFKEVGGWRWVFHALWGLFEISPACRWDGVVLPCPGLNLGCILFNTSQHACTQFRLTLKSIFLLWFFRT